MATDVSVAFTASDRLTDSLLRMKKNVKDLSRDVDEYRKIQQQAFEKKIDVGKNIEKEKAALKELKKASKDSSDSMVKDIAEKEKALVNLQEEHRRLGRVARDAFKEEKKLQEEISKSSNKFASRSRTDIMSSLSGAGLGMMLGNSVQGAATQLVTSAYGTTTGNIAGNVAGSAISGAAIGSIAGPVGAAVGAAVGGLSGAIKGLSENMQRNDDFYRTEVQSLHETAKQDLKNSLSNGIERSSSAAQNINALVTLLKSESKGTRMFEDIKRFGIDTPYEAEGMLNSAKQMLAYGVKENDIMNDIRMIGEVAMGNQAKFDSLAYVYAQTQSAGRLTGQDLRQYTEAGFNPLKVLAEESGKTLEDMRGRMSDGLVSAEDVTRAFKIASSEGGQFYGAMAKQMETYGGQVSMLTDIKNEIDRAMGDGFTKERQKGMEKEIELLSGKMGEQMQEAYSLIGTYQADLENKHQESIIKAITEAQRSEEYQKALSEDNGAEMGRIIAEAKAKAETEYKNSEGYKLQLEADLAMVKSIQEDAALNRAYIDYGKKMADAFSLGYSSIAKNAIVEKDIATIVNEGIKQKSRLPSAKSNNEGTGRNWKSLSKNGYATGLGRVPTDGYYKLHEGEKVVTRVNADKGNTKVNFNNYFTIQTEQTNQAAEDVARVILTQLEKASEVYGGEF